MDTGLPSVCAVNVPGSEEVVLIIRGESGYRACQAHAGSVDDINSALGVTPDQRKAMLAGSMCGWDVPAASQSAYTLEGKFVL